MTKHSGFVELVIEQLAPFGRPQIRAMFGGFGVYRDGLIFAIIVDDTLYFKADPLSRKEFEARGQTPFTYAVRGRSVAMQYYEAPAEVFEGPEAMRVWAEKAYGAALRARQAKSRKTGSTLRKKSKR